MPAARDTHEPRPQAIWPWVLMPAVVLMVYFALNHFKDVAQSAAAQAHAPAAATSAGTSEP